MDQNNIPNNLISSSETIFSIHTYKKNTSKSFIKEDRNRVLFIIKGECDFKYNEILEFSLSAKYFFFLSINDSCLLHFKSDTSILSLHFDWINNDYFRETIHQLTPYAATLHNSSFTPLIFNSFIDAFTKNMCECINHQLHISRFFEIKSEEVFFLIQAFYSKDELIRFFYGILKKDTEFANTVTQNFIVSQTIEELAFITNCSISTFKRKFKETFNDTPHNWIIRQKAKFIYRDLGNQNLPLSVISDKYRFSSFSHFSTFCKQRFGAPPSEIRKRIKENYIGSMNIYAK